MSSLSKTMIIGLTGGIVSGKSTVVEMIKEVGLHKRSRVVCSEACAEMLGFGDAWRFDPCALRAVVKRVG